MIDSKEKHLPILCDRFPEEPAIWYSTASKTLISHQLYQEKTELSQSSIPFNIQNLKRFFGDSVKELNELKLLVEAHIQRIDAFENSPPQMTNGIFLEFISQVNQLCKINSIFKEERKVTENFDWLFKGSYESKFLHESIPKLDAKLIDLKKEWLMIQSWFDNKKIQLENIYTATVDGFTAEAFHSKCDS